MMLATRLSRFRVRWALILMVRQYPDTLERLSELTGNRAAGP